MLNKIILFQFSVLFGSKISSTPSNPQLARWFAAVLVPLLFVGVEAKGQSKKTEPLYKLPQLVAIENRNHYFNHGLSLSVGYLPIDAFNKGLTLGASYTYKFTDYLAWEVVNGQYNFNTETGLKKDIQNLNVEIEDLGSGGELDYVDYYFTTNIVYTPIYSKNLVFNEKVVRGETGFLLGGGTVKFHNTGIKPMASVGAVFRYFLSEKTSIAVDAREHIYFDEETGADGFLYLGLGLSYQLGGKK